jgi:hypothetical protein
MSKAITVLATALFLATITSPASAAGADKFAFDTSVRTMISEQEYSWMSLWRATASDDPTDEFSFFWDHVLEENGGRYWQEVAYAGPYNGSGTTSTYHQRKLRAAHFRFSTIREQLDCIDQDSVPACEFDTLTLRVRWEGHGRRRVTTDGTTETTTRRATVVATLTFDGVTRPGSDHMVGTGTLVRVRNLSFGEVGMGRSGTNVPRGPTSEAQTDVERLTETPP